MLALLAALAVSAPAVDHRELIGRSVMGRPIRAIERGDPFAQRGCWWSAASTARPRRPGSRSPAACSGCRCLPASISGSCPTSTPTRSPLGTRANADGVNLNRNFAGRLASARRPAARLGGAAPFSEPETRAARRLILRVRPTVTIWYHQHMNLVWASGPSERRRQPLRPADRDAIRALRLAVGHRPHWQNVALSERSFVVELPPGRLAAAGVARHARAVLRLV